VLSFTGAEGVNEFLLYPLSFLNLFTVAHVMLISYFLQTHYTGGFRRHLGWVAPAYLGSLFIWTVIATLVKLTFN
jgi:hypothetical protein